MKKIRKAIVIPDMQVPYHDEKAVKCVEKYMKDNKWDYYINLGDFVDNFTISKYNKDAPGLVEGKTVMNDLNQAKEILERQLKIVRKNNSKVECYYLEGNHERRAYDYVNKHPDLKGLIEPENALKLKENGVKYLRSWSHNENLKIGSATFTHGRYATTHHAKKMVETFDGNVFYGHMHDTNAYNKTCLGDKDSKIGQSLGCLCEYPKEVDYTKGAPKNWQQAVTTFYFMPDGTFTYYVSRIINGKFISPDGKVYEG